MKIEYECSQCKSYTQHNQISQIKDFNLYRCNSCGEEVVLSDLELELAELEFDMRKS